MCLHASLSPTQSVPSPNPNPETVHVPFCYNASPRPAVLPCSRAPVLLRIISSWLYIPTLLNLPPHLPLSVRALRLPPSSHSLVRRCLYTIVC